MMDHPATAAPVHLQAVHVKEDEQATAPELSIRHFHVGERCMVTIHHAKVSATGMGASQDEALRDAYDHLSRELGERRLGGL